MPGRVGDRSDGDLRGTASASAATSGDAGRTRPVKAASRKGSGARRATVSPLSFEALRSAISLSEARSILRQPTGCSNRVRHLDCYATWAFTEAGSVRPFLKRGTERSLELVEPRLVVAPVIDAFAVDGLAHLLRTWRAH